MAEIYNTTYPTKEQALKGMSQEHRETILKMFDIQNIMFVNPPSDKRYKKNECNYLIAYTKIIEMVQDDKNYNDECVKHLINDLYDKIFKHRRY